MGYVGNDTVRALRELAARLRHGDAPLIDLAGESGGIAQLLQDASNIIEDRQTVGERLEVEREQRGDDAQLCLWLGDWGQPLMRKDVLTFQIGKKGAEEHVGIHVGLLPHSRLPSLAIDIGTELKQAYERGRRDVQREARDGAKGLIEALGLETKRLG